MDEHKQKERVRHSVDARLSGLQGDPWLAKRVLANAKGEQKVKKKISVGLVLALVLVLAAVTALAAMTLNALYEKTLEKEGQSGLIQDWSISDKVALVDWMVEAGVELNEEQVAKLHNDSLSDADKGTLAMEIIGGYYPARDGILTSVDIIAKEKGPIEYWTLEDKAWFSEMVAKYQPEEVSSVNLLPTQGDITKEQAIEIMYAYYEKEYGLKREDFDESKMAISFSEGTWDDGSGPERLKTWGMDLWLKADLEHPMGISILPDGSIKSASAPYNTDWHDEWYNTFHADDFWTIDGLYYFKEEWAPRVSTMIANGEAVNNNDLMYLLTKNFSKPKKTDISRNEAYEIARNAILSQPNWSEEKLKLFGTREGYVLEDNESLYWFVFTYYTYPLDERSEAIALNKTGEIPRRIIVKIAAVDGRVQEIIESNSMGQEDRLGF